jgi:hypothetical protein
VSADTLQRGIDELRDHGLLSVTPRRIAAPRTRQGWTMVNEYRLLPPFTKPEPSKRVDRAGGHVMTSSVLTFAKKILTYVAALGALLATISGCVQAIEWGTKTIGVVPVAMIGTFVLGCILTAAVMHARSPRSTPPVSESTVSTRGAGS